LDGIFATCTGILGVLWPSLILSFFATGPLPSLGIEMTRWFSMFLFFFGYLQWKCPSYGLGAIQLFHRGAFLADIIYPYVFFSLMRNGGSFTFTAFAIILYHFWLMWNRRAVLQNPACLL
jgi:hypothetical protein